MSVEEAAIAAGATVLGEGPVHYLLTAEQLEQVLRLVAGDVPPPPY